MSLFFAVLLVACQDSKVGVYNTPPVPTILGPAEGAAFDAGDLVELIGEVLDAQTDAPLLDVRWSSSLDGELGAITPDATGQVFLALDSLSSGSHAITLSAVDEGGASGSASVGITVGTDSSSGAPTIVLLGPTDGQEVPLGDVVNVVAAVTDDEDPYDTITVEILDSPDGSMWVGNPGGTGSLSVPLVFSEGRHALSLLATDSDGNIATQTVNFEVFDSGRPRAEILAPSDGSTSDLAVPLVLRGQVGDDATAATDLLVTWSSDVTGVLSTTAADSSGIALATVDLPLGVHVLTLSVTDGEGKVGTDTALVNVTDPRARDDDMDGYTENDGDCDDADPLSNPGLADICDDLDNNCSGAVNEPYHDSYERNESMSAPYDFGEVDSSFLWSSSSLELSGLTVSDREDEDWFRWDADDEIYDNVSISVSITGLPAGGNYVIELYDEGGSVVDTDNGSGSLSVGYSGDVFDTDEDVWYLRVYALTWPANSCSGSYTVRIRS